MPQHPKTSLGIWAMGSMVTRFNPNGYKPELAGLTTAAKVRTAVSPQSSPRQMYVMMRSDNKSHGEQRRAGGGDHKCENN